MPPEGRPKVSKNSEQYHEMDTLDLSKIEPRNKGKGSRIIGRRISIDFKRCAMLDRTIAVPVVRKRRRRRNGGIASGVCARGRGRGRENGLDLFSTD